MKPKVISAREWAASDVHLGDGESVVIVEEGPDAPDPFVALRLAAHPAETLEEALRLADPANSDLVLRPEDVVIHIGDWDQPDRTTFRVWFKARGFDRTEPEETQVYALFRDDVADLESAVASVEDHFLGSEAAYRPFAGCGAPTLAEMGEVIGAADPPVPPR
jgi:hypothetical protein